MDSKLLLSRAMLLWFQVFPRLKITCKKVEICDVPQLKTFRQLIRLLSLQTAKTVSLKYFMMKVVNNWVPSLTKQTTCRAIPRYISV